MIIVHHLFPKSLTTTSHISLKMTGLTPGRKIFDKSIRDNYRPVSILPTQESL